MHRSDEDGSGGRGSIRIAPRSALPLQAVSDPVISVLGAGRVTRALMTTAALMGARERFLVWARSDRSAELLRIHLADLPRLDVDVVVSDSPVVDPLGLIVLAHGARTSRFSRQRSKQALFESNLAMITQDIAKLQDRVVLVLTNPTASIVAALVRQGIHAYGVGVFNDQLRFENDAPSHLRLVGAHNPFELSYGSLSVEPPPADYSFSRAQYVALLNRQDRFRLMLNTRGVVGRFAGGVANRAWADIAQVHEATAPARRWYARQRLASRYLENGIAAACATLYAARFLRGAAIEREDVTLEAPLALPGMETPVLMGWPFDVLTRRPRPLTFEPDVAAELHKRARPYLLSGLQGDSAITLAARQGVVIRCHGLEVLSLWPDAFPVVAPVATGHAKPGFELVLSDDPASLAASVQTESGSGLRIAQHRGKNPFEHRDLVLARTTDGQRLITFEKHGGVALIDDHERKITLAASTEADRRDEFRKLLRDQLAVPAWLARGAAALHAGLLSLHGRTLLLTGGSGAGKTTGALHALHQQSGGYGASERVLLFRDADTLLALGVPESLTVFPGSLRGLAEFADVLSERDPSRDWLRDAKLRLSRDETLRRLGVEQIAAPARIDAVLDLHYQGDLALAVTVSPPLGPEARLTVLAENDLTEADDVRAAWLNWFETARDPGLFPTFGNSAIPMHRIVWRDGAALGACLVAFANAMES